MRTVITILMLFFTIVDLTPLIFNFSLVQDPESAHLTHVLKSATTLRCLIYTAGTTVPMLIDVLSYFIHRDAFFLSARAALLIALLFPCVMIAVRDNPNRTDLFIILNAIQILWIAGALASGMTRSDATALRSYNCYLFYGVIGISQVLSPFAEVKGTAGEVLLILNIIFFTVGAIFVIWMFVSYIREIWWKSSFDDIKANEYLPLICITQIVIFIIAYAIVAIVFNLRYMQDAGQFVCSFGIIIASFVAVITTLLPGRIARSQVR